MNKFFFIVALLCSSTIASAQDGSEPIAGEPLPLTGPKRLIVSVNVDSKGNVSALSKHVVLLDFYYRGNVVATERRWTDGKGHVTFDNISDNNEIVVQVRSFYEDAPFRSALIQVATMPDAYETELTLFKNTAERDDLQIDGMNILFYAEEGSFLVAVEQSFILSNRGTEAFYDKVGLFFPLPDKALDIEIAEGGPVQLVNDQLVFKDVLSPNSLVGIITRFKMPRKFARIKYKQEVSIPVQRLVVGAHPPFIEIEGDFTKVENQKIREVEHAFYRTDLPIGTKQIVFSVRNIPGGFDTIHLILVVVLFGIVVLGVVFVRNRKNSSTSGDYLSTLKKLKALDAAFKSGLVDQLKYNENRDILLNQLVELKKRDRYGNG